MAKLYVVAIKDRALDTFIRPFVTPALGAAIREFQDAINDPQAPMHKHPEDYDMYELGLWDDTTGLFTGKEPTQIAIGKNAVMAKH